MDIQPKDVEEYEYALADDTNVHRIDEFIKYYVEYIEKCIMVKQNKFYKNDIKEFFIQSTFEKIGVLSGFDNHFVDNIIEHISEQDIKDYEDKKLEERLIKDLEKKFEHKSKEKYEDWYLIGNTNRNIELHYGMYMIYTPNDKVNHNDFKEAIDFKITTDINEIDDEHIGDFPSLMSKLTYKTKNDEIKEINAGLQINRENGKFYYSTEVFLYCLFYDQTKGASIEIRQHDWDKERAEWEAMIEEKQLNKSTRNQVSEETIEIPEFKKYKADAKLIVYTYDDGSIEVYFYGPKRIKKNGNIDMDERRYKLPYDDVKTKEEALEHYLNDKEHYNSDEEFLRKDNMFYTGE